MSRLQDIINPFEEVINWPDFVKNNFERRAGLYNHMIVTELEINFNGRQLIFPKKITFENSYLKSQRNISQIERLTLNDNKVKMKETKRFIPLGLYQRTGKFSGEISEIIHDIIDNKVYSTAYFSPKLLSTHEDALFSIDSSQKWPSYVLVLCERFNDNEKSSNTTNEQISLKEALKEYGISYEYEQALKETVLIIFPMPYIKIVENKIKREGYEESIFLVLEFNQLSFFYADKNLKFEIDSLIKDTNGNVIYQKLLTIKFGRAKFQVVELLPESNKEIGFASLCVRLNGIAVDVFSGYYIRNIKIETKII